MQGVFPLNLSSFCLFGVFTVVCAVIYKGIHLEWLCFNKIIPFGLFLTSCYLHSASNRIVVIL